MFNAFSCLLMELKRLMDGVMRKLSTSACILALFSCLAVKTFKKIFHVSEYGSGISMRHIIINRCFGGRNDEKSAGACILSRSLLVL